MCIAWVIASIGTWYSCFAVGFTCFSWWFPPPRWLGAARIIEQRLVIVSGSDRGDWEGSCAFPSRAPKGNSSGLLVSLSYLTCGRFLRCPIVWTRFMQHLLAAEPPSVGRHNGDIACWQACEPREKIDCLSSLSFSRWLAIYSSCDWFIPYTSV